jgi:hypothetical protein
VRVSGHAMHEAGQRPWAAATKQSIGASHLDRPAFNSGTKTNARLGGPYRTIERQFECAGYPQSPAHPAARWGRYEPLPTEPFAEGVGVCRISETEADVVLLIVMPSASATGFDPAFAVEGHYVVRLGSEAA